MSDKINMKAPSAESIAREFGYDRCIVIGFKDSEKHVEAIPFTQIAVYSKVKGDSERLLSLANVIIDGGGMRCKAQH